MRAFLGLYLLSLPFNNLLTLPIVGQKVQPPEIIFLFCILAILFRGKGRALLPRRWLGMDFGVLGLLTAFCLLGLYHRQPTVWLEFLGLGYLAGVYLLFRGAMQTMPQADTFAFWAFRGMGVAAAATVVVGLVLAFLFPMVSLELYEQKYIPYLGYFPRVKGFASSPNMLASILGMALLLEVGRLVNAVENRKAGVVFALVFLLALGATFSKSILPILAGACLLIFRNPLLSSVSRQMGLMIGLGLVVVFAVQTHWILLPEDDARAEIVLEQSYASSERHTLPGGREAVGTMHVLLKREALAGFASAPFFGLGPGRFASWLQARQQSGHYPATKPLYDPHSLYTGVLAEGGLFGLMGLIIFLVGTISLVSRRFDRRLSSGLFVPLLAGLSAAVIVLLIDGLVMDVLHFRHLWVALGIMAGGMLKSGLDPTKMGWI